MSLRTARQRCISIHAAREGGDTFGQNAPMKEFVISIHAAREGGDSVMIIG